MYLITVHGNTVAKTTKKYQLTLQYSSHLHERQEYQDGVYNYYNLHLLPDRYSYIHCSYNSLQVLSI